MSSYDGEPDKNGYVPGSYVGSRMSGKQAAGLPTALGQRKRDEPRRLPMREGDKPMALVCCKKEEIQREIGVCHVAHC